MRVIATVALLTLIVPFGRPVSAEAQTTLLAPSQLNPNLDPATAKALDAAFNQAIGKPPVRGLHGALAAAPKFVIDPYTHKQLNTMVVANEVIAIEKLYQQRYKHPMRTYKIDLDILASNSRMSIKTQGTHARASASRANVTSVAVPTARLVNKAAGLTAATCTPIPRDTPPKEIASQWAAIQAYASSQSPDVCTLAFADTLKNATSQPPAFVVPPFGFGNAATAYGSVEITPLIASQSDGSLVASLKTGFKATVLNGTPLSMLESVVKVTVPPKNSGTDITSDVSISGGALSSTSLYHASTKLGPSSNSYQGKKTKDFDFWTFSKSWDIPLGPLTTTVTASADVSGNADISYKWEGDAVGMYATANPSVSASARGSVGASNVLCGKCSVDSKFTVQDSESSIDALLARVSYLGKDYAVERLYAVYKPPTYEATIEAHGHLAIVFYFDQFLMKSPKTPLGDGFSFDSGWSVQAFPQ